MQQDSLLVSLAGVGTSVLPPLAHFGFGVKKQIKRQPMAGELAPEGPVQTQVRDGRSSGRSSIQGGILVMASPGRHPTAAPGAGLGLVSAGEPEHLQAPLGSWARIPASRAWRFRIHVPGQVVVRKYP